MVTPNLQAHQVHLHLIQRMLFVVVVTAGAQFIPTGLLPPDTGVVNGQLKHSKGWQPGCSIYEMYGLKHIWNLY